VAIERFGPFALDRSRRRLFADGRVVSLSDRQIDVLLILTSQPGTIVSKDALIEAAWNGTAVTDDSLYAAVKELRSALGAMSDGHPYIETLNRRGYRFAGRIEQATPASNGVMSNISSPVVPSVVNRTRRDGAGEHSDGALAAEDPGAIERLLEPYRAFLDGQAALERLDVAEVVRARDTFALVLQRQPHLTAAHIGLASACVLQYEATRADASPDHHVLAEAEHHARRACALAPDHPDAWSTLALVYHRLPLASAAIPLTSRASPLNSAASEHHAMTAIAAARKAVSLDSHEWRHHLRLAFVAGGAERLRAAHRVLDLRPGLALAHWLAATVFVARQAFGAALEQVHAGCAAQDAQDREGSGFGAVGLHLLHGMLLARYNAIDAAHAELARELETAHPGHIYTREACANACYARGALYLRAGDDARAHQAFEEAVEHLPSHPIASALLANARCAPPSSVGSLSQAMTSAALLAADGRHAAAARLCEESLTQCRSGPGAAWILPVEPLIHVAAHRRIWAHALAVLQQRAS